MPEVPLVCRKTEGGREGEGGRIVVDLLPELHYLLTMLLVLLMALSVFCVASKCESHGTVLLVLLTPGVSSILSSYK